MCNNQCYTLWTLWMSWFWCWLLEFVLAAQCQPARLSGSSVLNFKNLMNCVLPTPQLICPWTPSTHLSYSVNHSSPLLHVQFLSCLFFSLRPREVTSLWSLFYIFQGLRHGQEGHPGGCCRVEGVRAGCKLTLWHSKKGDKRHQGCLALLYSFYSLPASYKNRIGYFHFSLPYCPFL